MHTTTGSFETEGGRRLFERHWLPEGGARADLVIVHGYAEHSGRYERAGAYLADRGFAVHAFDLRGHGRSDGERVLVRSIEEYLDDVDAFLGRVRARSGARPLFLLGHSMGGGIVAAAMVTRRPGVRGVLLSGAVLPTGSGGIWRSLMMRVMIALGRLAPTLRLRRLAAETVSRDPAVVALYDSDPLNFRGKMPAGTAGAMMSAVRTIERQAGEIACPLLIMHGTADALTSPDGSRWLYAHVSSADKTLKLYEGLYHEILNEPEQREVMEDIASWIEARSDEAGGQSAASGVAANSGAS